MQCGEFTFMDIPCVDFWSTLISHSIISAAKTMSAH
jgi:hypothetical protein